MKLFYISIEINTANTLYCFVEKWMWNGVKNFKVNNYNELAMLLSKDISLQYQDSRKWVKCTRLFKEVWMVICYIKADQFIKVFGRHFSFDRCSTAVITICDKHIFWASRCILLKYLITLVNSILCRKLYYINWYPVSVWYR